MDVDGQNIEKITNGIISYLEFLKQFNKVIYDNFIQKESYIFLQFNLECYIIDKKYLDDFKTAINFDELIYLLNPIDGGNKNKFKIELKKYLEKRSFRPDGENIKLYSDKEEIKDLIRNFNNYSFINKELLDAMGVPEYKLEGKMLKVSKNEIYISLLSISNNYIININIEKDKEKIFTNNNDNNYILNKIKSDEGYDLKLNNISYNLQIYNNDNYIYFNLFEKSEMLYYSKKYDLKSII